MRHSKKAAVALCAPGLILTTCEKCGAEVGLPATRTGVAPHPFLGELGAMVAVVDAGGVWSDRHDGQAVRCPLHPGMTYFLTVELLKDSVALVTDVEDRS